MILSKLCLAGWGDDGLPYVVGEVKSGSPHVRPWIEIVVFVLGSRSGSGSGAGPAAKRLILRLWWTLWAIVSATSAGEDGWSVIVALWAAERLDIRDGRAVPGRGFISQWHGRCGVSGVDVVGRMDVRHSGGAPSAAEHGPG